MSSTVEKFDPYHTWLGIPAKDQPPNHYRLLAIKHFERDPDAIDGAADRRTAHVRSFSAGKLGRFAHKLLNEINAARLCLLDKHRKAAYDDSLREKLARAAKKEASKIPPPPPGKRTGQATSETSRMPPPSSTPSDEELLAAVEYADALPAEAAVGVSASAVANSPPRKRWR
jgi:hypothetical protein